MNDSQARILVVDDAPLIRILLTQVLTKYGYAVDTAEDGQQAIHNFIHHSHDLILMDADMPVLDGVEACAQIRQLPEAKYLPIIMVTSFGDREWVDRAYAAGATDYITKPVNWDVLRNRIHYILQAKHAEEALFKEKEKAQVTLASIGDGVIATDAKGRVEYFNPVAARLTGWSVEEAKGLPLKQVFTVVDEATHQPFEFPIERCLEDGHIIEIASNTVLCHRSGEKTFAIEDSAAPIRDRNGQIIGVVLVFHDVTENRKLTQELSFKANHDALTGLFNLHEFNAKLQTLLEKPRLSGVEHCLLYMDLDQFKIVNDTCGHEAGDQLLRNVALLLQQSVEAHKTICQQVTLARLGGDEFSLLMEGCTLANALTIAQEMIKSVENFKFFWRNDKHENTVFTIGMSIGAVSIPPRASNRKRLLAMADAACYAAKNAGRNGVHVFHEDDAELLDRHKEIQWLSLIHDNLERPQGFSLFYQRITSIQAPTQPLYYEVLLRMDDQEGHLLPPGSFLSAATRHGLMLALDQWVVRTILEWLNAHPRHLEELGWVSINISYYALSSKDFLNFIIDYSRHCQVPLNKLCFEISEAVAITHLSSTTNFIIALREFGCRFALDDFGSGMSSFSYLKNLPLDFLKIDGGLIKNIAQDAVDCAMVKSINEIAHLMKLSTIAKSVENEVTFTQLKNINVDYVQGYYIGYPQPINVHHLKS